jgi:hypothetical protein
VNPFRQGIGVIPTTRPAAAGGGVQDMAAMLMQGAGGAPAGGASGSPYGPGGDAWIDIVQQMMHGGPHSGLDFASLPKDTRQYLRPK